MNADNKSQPSLSIIVIKRQKRKDISQRTQKDHYEINLRRRQFGLFYDEIYKTLESLFAGTAKQKILLSIAKCLGAKYNIQLDRLSKRSYQCLICWFCQNWDKVHLDVYMCSKFLYKPSEFLGNIKNCQNENISTAPQREKKIDFNCNDNKNVSDPNHLFLGNTGFLINQKKLDFLSIPSVANISAEPQIKSLSQNDYPFSIKNISNNGLQVNESSMLKCNENGPNHVIIRHFNDININVHNNFDNTNLASKVHNESNKLPFMPRRFKDYIFNHTSTPI